MKTAGRIIIILLAAALVTGAMLAFASSPWAASLRSSLPGRDGFDRGMPAPGLFANGAAPNGGETGLRSNGALGRRGFRDGGEQGRRGGSLAGFVEVAKNGVIMALVVLLIVPAAALLRRLRRGRPTRQPPAAPAAPAM